MSFQKQHSNAWTEHTKAERIESQSVALEEGKAEKARRNAEAPRLVALERAARKSFEQEMNRRNACEFESVNWWRCHERAQVWHDVAALACEIKKGEV